MPYISPDRRTAIAVSVKETPQTEGELNWAISWLLSAYMQQHGLSYDRMGDCTGACENAAAEFRRRVMASYEDSKIEQNGDVGYESLTW